MADEFDEFAEDMPTALPDDAYLSTYYHDPHRGRETTRVYYLDGRVMRHDGDEWAEVCRFTPEEVEQTQTLLIECGLLEAEDISRPDDLYDAAQQVWRWRLAEQGGEVANHAYPAVRHPVFECVKMPLYEMEQTARSRG